MTDGPKEDETELRVDGLAPEAMAELFEALANPRRLRVLRYLTDPRYLREVASEFDISRQAAHHHLDKLAETGLLRRKKGSRETGPVTEYVLVPAALAIVHEALERVAGLPHSTPDRPGRTLTMHGSNVAVSQPSRRSLWVVRGLDAGTTLDVGATDDGPWVMGRDRDCDLVLAGDPFVSARHAEVWMEEGDLRLGDLASENGTYHEGRRLDRREGVVLDHGDVVGLGRSVLLYQDP